MQPLSSMCCCKPCLLSVWPAEAHLPLADQWPHCAGRRFSPKSILRAYASILAVGGVNNWCLNWWEISFQGEKSRWVTNSTLNAIISDCRTVSRQSGRIIAALFVICPRFKERKLSTPSLPACALSLCSCTDPPDSDFSVSWRRILHVNQSLHPVPIQSNVLMLYCDVVFLRVGGSSNPLSSLLSPW